MGRGGLFAGAAARIALLVAALAAAMFLLVRDGVAAESDRALLPPVVAACEEGECPSVVLCEPGSVWDARARTCRQVSFCPGDRKVQIPGGPCELYCRPGMEANPFDPNRCRPVVSCPQGTTEKADGVCEIACPDGRQENPYAPGTCHPAFFCPDGHEEVAEGKCAPQCGAGEERDPQDGCRPIPLTAAFCAWSDMAYDAVEKKCLSFPHYCPLIGKIHEPFANRCVANPEICQQHGMVYIATEDRCRPPADDTCRMAGIFFHVDQCVSIDPASCPAMGRIYDSDNDQCAASAEICEAMGQVYIATEDRCRPPADDTCRMAGMFFHVDQCVSVDPASCPAMGRIYDSDNDQCAASAEICEAMGQVYIANDDRCRPPADDTCRTVEMFFYVDQCVSVDPASCPTMGRIYDSDNDQCIASPEICKAMGRVYELSNDRCAASPEVCETIGQVYESSNDQCAASEEICAKIGQLYETSANRCVADAESCAAEGLVYIPQDDKCLAAEEICRNAGMAFVENRCVALTQEYCRQMGQVLDNNQCVANEGVCGQIGLVYDPGVNQCIAISAEGCRVAGKLHDPVGNQCVAACAEGTEPVDNACLSVCRNNDHNGRFYYNPEAHPVFSHSNLGAIPPPVERIGGCVCPPGPEGDQCRELDRSHGTTTVKLPFAHSLTLANGEFLLGQGVSVGVMEVGPLLWQDSDDTVRTHSDLPSVQIFCGTDEQENKLPCYDTTDDGIREAFHGIAVLGVMAAKKDGKGLVGVAPESDYLYAWFNYHPLVVYQDLVTNGASIINNSWTPEFYITAHDFNPCSPLDSGCRDRARNNLRAYARQEHVGLGGRNLRLNDNRAIDLEVDELFTNYNHATSQKDVSPADRPIYVWSAGNNNGRKVTANITIRAADNSILTVLRKDSIVTATALAVIPGLPYYFPDMTLNNLAVAAVDEFREEKARRVVDGETLYQSPIASFSNRCGEGASSFCLAAPGVASYNWHTNAEYVEIARTVNNCNFMRTFFARVGSRYRCVDDAVHEDILTRLVAEKFRTGLGSGFVLVPETEEFAQQEKRLIAGYDETQGTSFAAPIVSGALALMKSYFMLGTDCGAGGECGLGSHELVERILATADRRGIYADASIYGSGLLDLKNALSPQGELRLLLGRSVQDSSSHLLSQSALHPGAALGDSALRALGGVRLAAFDDMNAPFPVFGDAVLYSDDSAEEAGGVAGAGVGEALRAHQLGFRGRRHSPASDWDFEDGYGFLTLQGGDFLSSWGVGVGVGVGGSGSADKSLTELGGGGFGNPYSALVGDGMVAGVVGDGFRMAAFGEGLGVSRRIRGAFAEFSLAPFSSLPEGTGLSFQVGGMEELDGLLDTSGAGIFGGLRARTAFAGLGFSGELPGDWRVRLGGFAGRTAAEDEGGWFSSVEDLWSGAYALGLERDNVLFAGDALGFRVHQPLRTSGGLQLRVPTGRTRYGDLTWREVSGGPSGRELIWEGLYRRSAEEGDWLLSAGLISQPGHRADAKTQGRALLAFERAF